MPTITMSVQSVDDTGSGISYSGSYTISTTSEQSVDDTDPSISYSGSWNTYQLHDALVYHGTIHSTTQNGASATLTFQGLNAVGVNLVIPACSGFVAGSWTRDGQTGKVGIPCTSGVQEDYPFYPYTAGSSFGLNTIIVRNAGSVPFQLDRFILGNVTNDTPSSTTPGTPSITTTTSSISTAAVSSNSPITSNLPISGVTSPSSNSTGIATALNAITSEGTTTSVSSAGVISPQLTGVSKNTPSSSSPRSLPLGPIVGGALGALALLLLFIIFLIKCRPWKKEKSNRAETVPSSTVTPFSIQETPVGYFGSDDKTALAIAESSLSFTSGQSSHICSPRAQSDINDNPTANPQERDPLDPESLSTLTPENRASLAPSYSPDRRHFQSEFSDISTSCAADVPPAYHSLNIPSGLEARPNVEQIEEKIINCP